MTPDKCNNVKRDVRILLVLFNVLQKRCLCVPYTFVPVQRITKEMSMCTVYTIGLVYLTIRECSPQNKIVEPHSLTIRHTLKADDKKIFHRLVHILAF